jgi:hypothetical protein
MREESHELGALISKLRLDHDEMSFETYIHMEGEEIIELDLSIEHYIKHFRTFECPKIEKHVYCRPLGTQERQWEPH